MRKNSLMWRLLYINGGVICWWGTFHLKEIISDLEVDVKSTRHYTWFQGQLRRRGKPVIRNNVEFKNKILSWLHSSGVCGYSGRDITVHRVKRLFY
ncbi:hypothetical protein V2J09_021668 [Rumex salicifolius]